MTLAAVPVAAEVATLETTEPSRDESLAGWQYRGRVELPEDADARWIDFVLPLEVFASARYDLGDLRLYDTSGREIPYALRVRRKEDRTDLLEATEFNRAVGKEGSTKLSVDLGEQPIEHNEVHVEMPSMNFRRAATVEGSDDRNEWSRLVRDDQLIRFRSGKSTIDDCVLSYPPSRFRYLQITVDQDPVVDKGPVKVSKVTVRRRVEVPGETVTHVAVCGPREPVRADGAPGSAWIANLRGENIPCEEIEVDAGDPDFVRSYYLERGGPPDSQERFFRFHSGQWRRRAGRQEKPITAEFNEVRTSRLRLVVTDHRNPPLDIRAVRFMAPARQIVFARPKHAGRAVYLYYGNPKAESPHYDFAGNLPARLAPEPSRAKLGPREENPDYQPEPLPFTERWPWAIYVVLGSVGLVLAVMIASVSRRAIAAHDA